MLTELRVRDLGVIADLTLELGPGMTALTGETGAGKTLVVEAIGLLLGARADPVLVRPGRPEATVEARFTGADAVALDTTGDDPDDRMDERVDDELIVARTVPARGRSRAYLDGRMTPVLALAEAGRRLVDLHGQHAQQSLLHPEVQRAALDAFGAMDHSDVIAARRALRDVEAALAGLGGDARARVRELDLLRFQVAELDAARLDDPLEDDRLAAEEDLLADATAHREAASAGHHTLAGDGGAIDHLAAALSLVGGRVPLATVAGRLEAIAADLADTASELRQTAESLEDDPERLAEVGARRQLLRDLRRKYGDELADVIAFADQARARLDELSSYEERAARLDGERRAALAVLAHAEAALGAARRAAAPRLAGAIEGQLRRLAIPRARFHVEVGDDPAGERITWLLSANAGEPALPLTKVASGGELARTMLAARLVLSQANGGREVPADGRTLVFDEVDAGIGGEAAVAVGRALAELSRHHQVLVVTHLPQVAAFADCQIAVKKEERQGRTVARAEALGPDQRVVELSRMLSGQPDSATARLHAEELLAFAGAGTGAGVPAPPRRRRRP
ncbi:MAG TPA: DNA repair protein RecN [Acidimicrobiales bacterium]|nr:DNA repair protein RecN [Acidimicrobiales bacterium]